MIKEISEGYAENEENDGERGQINDIGINGHLEQPSGTGVDREMRELQEAIRLIHNNYHQPLRVFSISNSIER